ncbi:MAG: hypothetical protein CL581_14510 [Alteromonadaceae bacterium]|nr:hypothetical protein [Alteromonadaceae bacterium]MBH86845.1 hypothetical protein [Alteromonadaceae bacterium]
MTSNAPRAARMLTVRSALAYLALLAGVAFFVPNAGILGAAAVILAIILGWRDLRRVSRIIFSLLIAAFVAAIFIEPTALLTAANNMTRLTTLIISVMLLSSMLGHSKDLDTISRSLFAGKPLARYYSIAFGTAFLSVPLNFGSVGVVATMIRGEITRRGDTAMTQNASRGALRGFGASPISSPLSISIVLTVTLLPGLHSWQLIAVSFPVAVLYLLSGALFRTPEPALARPDDFKPSGPMPWLRFAGIIGAICISTMLLSTLAGLSYSRAVAFSCLGAVAVGLVMRRLEGSKISLPTMAPVTNELVIVGGSAFLGALISAFALQLMGEDFTLHGWAYPATAFCVPFVFYLGGMVGLNPIVIGTLTGGVLAPIWPSEALLGLGVGMVSGWGITTAGTPHTANSLLLERITGYSAHMAAIRWNLVLSLTSLTCTGLLAAGLTAGLRML